MRMRQPVRIQRVFPGLFMDVIPAITQSATGATEPTEISPAGYVQKEPENSKGSTLAGLTLKSIRSKLVRRYR